MILSSLISMLSLIVTLFALVFIHEYGHYFFARFFGVKVEQFSVGFGPSLFLYNSRDEVQWRLCALPFGGFVKMFDVSGLTKNDVAKSYYSLTLESKKLYQKLIIIAAGPLANLVFAIVILIFFYWCQGCSINHTLVKEVRQDSAANLAGIIAGDEIIEVDNKDISDFNDLKVIMNFDLSKKIKLKIKRGDEYFKFDVISRLQGKIEDIIPYIGIKAATEKIYKSMNLTQIIMQVFLDIKNALKAIWSMLLGKRSIDSLGSFVTIVNQGSEQICNSFCSFILLLANLSINLGLINLLPIPILDGGKIILLLYSTIVKKPPSQRQSSFLINISALIIIFLIVISLSNDIKNLIS